jgi:hypothetical protein
MDGPQLKAHTAQLVTLKLNILQNPGLTASPSQTTTTGLPTEVQLLVHGTKLYTFIHHLAQSSCAASQMHHKIKQCLQSDMQLLSVTLSTRQLLAVLNPKYSMSNIS